MPLVVDRFSEIFPLLENYAHGDFWDLGQCNIVPGAIYIVGRTQFYDHRRLIRDFTERSVARFILANPHEGSDTLRKQLEVYGMSDLVQASNILLIGGGDMDDRWPCLQYDHFLPKMFDYDENIAAAQEIDSVYQKKNKPHTFLFLNGRYRPHRAQMIQHCRDRGLLERPLWSNLDGGNGSVQLLPMHYEVDRYQSFADSTKKTGYVKFDLFNNEWGEIYLNARAYVDTYFSVVSETVYDYPHSFRTEKIWKPVAMGHPFVVIANQGYLRDLRQLGFRTFGDIIDESYDHIADDQIRLETVAELIRELIDQDLDDFLDQAYNICKYNQQHLKMMSARVRQEFPERFFQFLDRYQWTI